MLSYFGIQHGSPFYLATYDVTPEMLIKSLATISTAAKRIIELIEKDLPEVMKEDCAEQLAS